MKFTEEECKIFFMFSKGLFQPSNSKNCFGKMEFNLTKLKEVFIPQRTIIKNLFHILHSNHSWENLKYLHKSFFQKSTILLFESSTSKGIIRGYWDDCGEINTWVLLGTCPVIKTSPKFHTTMTIRDMHEKRYCNCFYF